MAFTRACTIFDLCLFEGKREDICQVYYRDIDAQYMDKEDVFFKGITSPWQVLERLRIPQAAYWQVPLSEFSMESVLPLVFQTRHESLPETGLKRY